MTMMTVATRGTLLRLEIWALCFLLVFARLNGFSLKVQRDPPPAVRDSAVRESKSGVPLTCIANSDRKEEPLLASRCLKQAKESLSVSRADFLAVSTVAFMTGFSQPPPAKATPDQESDAKKPSSMESIATNSFASTLKESISGFAAGASVSASKTIIKYPLDTATVRLQMPQTEYSIFRLGQLFDGSFRGVSAPLISNIPAGAIFFAVKDAAKANLRSAGVSRLSSTAIAVALAQCPYWLVRNPSEVIKTRQQSGIDGYGEGVSILDAFRLASGDNAKEGTTNRTDISGLYVGYWENIFYAYPADVIKFVCYECVTGGRKDLSPQEGAISGALSTAVAQLLTTPLDVVRNRVMAGEDQSIKSQGTKDENSYISSLVGLFKQEGLRGLFAGTAPRVGKAILSGAIQFAAYEDTKQRIGSFFVNK